MRYLDRTATSPPACLARYLNDPNADWEELSKNKADYREVCAALAALQGSRCAYCDCDLQRESDHPHIEHFVQRRRRPGRTFDWSNLFWSCSHEACCGKHKDNHAGAYADADLLKPDADQPRDFLCFSDDGRVWPKNGSRMGAETIRVFALDCARLRGIRRSYLSSLAGELEQMAQAGLSNAELIDYKKALASEWQQQPFYSAVLDVLGL